MNFIILNSYEACVCDEAYEPKPSVKTFAKVSKNLRHLSFMISFGLIGLITTAMAASLPDKLTYLLLLKPV